jgi:hypothetical protein
MSSAITEKTCEAWFVLEAGDLRGLPSPFVVRVTQHRTTDLGFKTLDELNAWAEAMGADTKSTDVGGMTQVTAEGTLHDFPVSVFACVTDLVAVAR